MKSCITDITVSDIIETRDSMITISIRKHLAEKLRRVFTMLHRLEGVLESSSIPKQGRDLTKKSSAKPTIVVKPTVKSEFEPKGKEKFFFLKSQSFIIVKKRS
ncbi:unnamed protein product [Lactuca saligna]|uniref:Uncharacterized protein n=1 Tax=Lactuca saligna TaxID=75948 RepID=A0AA35ZRA6_LACSI|nr:unnamed protein product [Lactuca saligna]